MAGAWGNSFGVSWGNAWGADAPPPTPPPKKPGSGDPDKWDAWAALELENNRRHQRMLKMRRRRIALLMLNVP